MKRESSVLSSIVLACALAGAPCVAQTGGGRYDQLVALFKEWRAFQQPKRVAGVYDYRPAAMAAQRAGLVTYRRRLEAIDPRAWPIPQQVDYQIVRAEMNGLDFDHRVLQPWV